MERITIKCPDCQGTRCNELPNGKYRCLYCGSTFAVESSKQDGQQPTPQQVQPQVIYIQQPVQNQPQTARTGSRTRTTAVVLALLLGGIGGQFFYLGKTMLGVLCLIFCWTWIPYIVAIIHMILLLCMSDDEFDRKYNTITA